MQPRSRQSRVPHILAVVGAAAVVMLGVALGHVLAGPAMLPPALLVSLLGGAAVAYAVELGGYANLRPVDRYRREREPLAGPRPGARLG